MSAFINKKEEVIQIELTAYGKFLLSKGKFSPKFYSFYDGDMIYEGNRPNDVTASLYTGFSENQNAIVQRIKDTQRLGVQANFSTLSGSTNNAESTMQEALKDEYEQITPTNNLFMKPIGTSSPFREYAPAWLIRGVTGSVGFASVEYLTDMKIPTLSSSIETEYVKESVILPDIDTPVLFYEKIEEQKLLIDIQELNTIFKGNGNYDIEVFKAPALGANDGRVERVQFINANSGRSGELFEQTNPDEYVRFLNGTDGMIEEEFPTIDSTYVEYFLSIKVDSEIEDLGLAAGTALYTGLPGGGPQDPCKD